MTRTTFIAALCLAASTLAIPNAHAQQPRLQELTLPGLHFAIIDEIDSVLSSRSEGEQEASRRLKTEFRVQLDGARRDPGLQALQRALGKGALDLQVATAWQRATGAVSAVGVPVRPSDTPLEVASSTARHFPLVTRPMASLAEVVTEATYRADGTAGYDAAGTYGSSTVSDCRNWAKQIDRAATESLDWPIRIRRYFSTFG